MGLASRQGNSARQERHGESRVGELRLCLVESVGQAGKSLRGRQRLVVVVVAVVVAGDAERGGAKSHSHRRASRGWVRQT